MPLNKTTYEMLDMLPSWMAIRNEESNGALVLDTAGTQLGQIEAIIEHILSSGFTATFSNDDMYNIDYLYRVRINDAITDQLTLSVVATSGSVMYDLQRATSIYDFYQSDDLKFFFDTEEYMIYTKDKFDSLIINTAPHEEIEKHHVWGPLDEIGLLIGCPRIVNEVNADYVIRLNDVYANPGSSSKTGLINYISRSLGISHDKVIVESLDNDDFVSSLMDSDGTPRDELKKYIEISNKVNSFGIDTYWSILDDTNIGLKYLPIIWDIGLSAWNDSQIQNGIGDTDDLEIIAPKQQTSEQEFEYSLYAEGLNLPDKKIYPEHKFKYKVYATGLKYDNGYRPEGYKYKITSSELIPLVFDAVAHKTYTHEYMSDFSGSTVLANAVTDINKKPNDYILSNVSIKNGKYVPNPTMRYFQLAATLKTKDSLVTPEMHYIKVNYVEGGVNKTLTIQGEDTVALDENGFPKVGFESNTWNDGSPIIRVKNDTNDSYNILTTPEGNITLSHGQYQKVYNSEGDWDDGMTNQETINVMVSNTGSLKLNI